jgi:hypothetical protein
MTQKQVPQLPNDQDMSEVTAKVDEIFESAKSNLWNFEQFAKKILAGTVACNPGYVAIASELIQTVTGLEREANHALLYYFVAKTNQLDTATINKAHSLFEQGLLIKCIQAS